MKRSSLLAGFVILTLLIGFSSSYFVNLAFADDEEDRIKKELQRMEKYREEQKEKQEKYKKEIKEKRDEYRKEIKEKHEKYREEISERQHEIKSKYNDLKDDYKKKYHDLKEELKNKFRALKQAQIAAQDSLDSDSFEISEEDILAFEAKRIELEELKKEFREKMLELKTQVRQDLEKLKQDYVDHEEERKNKIHDKLNDLKLKYKDRIKDIKKLRLQVILSSYSHIDSQIYDHKVSICHESGNSGNYHTISVSVNAVHAHMYHGDDIGPCENKVLDKIIEEISDDDTDENGIEDLTEEFEYKVRAETLGTQSEVKLELEFATETTSYASIVNEIIANFDLDKENAGILLKIQQDDDGELEEKFEIEIENKDGYSEVEVELRFVLDSTEQEAILAAIVDRSQLTAALVEEGLENEIGEDDEDEDDDDEDEDDDDEDD